MSGFLQQFSANFAQLNAHNLDRLSELYAENVHFTDPLHEICGLAELHEYFAELYANVTALDFAFFAFDEVREGEGYLRWIMSFRHPRLNQGQLISLEGCTMLRWDAAGKVVRHRDYFDAGALLYQHVPVVGSMIRWLHRRIAWTRREARLTAEPARLSQHRASVSRTVERHRRAVWTGLSALP